jgi:ATP-dependent Zn protease
MQYFNFKLNKMKKILLLTLSLLLFNCSNDNLLIENTRKIETTTYLNGEQSSKYVYGVENNLSKKDLNLIAQDTSYYKIYLSSNKDLLLINLINNNIDYKFKNDSGSFWTSMIINLILLLLLTFFISVVNID